MKQKIQTLLNQLNHGLVEREATLKTALLTVLAGENLVLIGPPGTGKSLIARRIAESFSHSSDNGYFEYLLNKFSTPEEIFGPLSITELKADRFKRNTAGYLPTVKIAFLDEIFKASSSILNALLTILNERVYHNGSEPQRVPMQALIAASNELPTDQEELSALYDRFLVRGLVDYVSQDNLPRLFENAGPMPELTQLTAADLDGIKNAAESVTIPPEIVQAVQRIWIQHQETFKEDRRESLSDRRLKKVIKLLCVSATTNGRSKVDLSDVFLLKDCLWNHQDNALKVRDLILNTLQQSHAAAPHWERNTDFRQQSPNFILSNILEFKIPDSGDFDEVTVIELLVKPGDVIKKGQLLITVESDKTAMKIPAIEGGRVKEMKIRLGDKVSEGDVILTLETGGIVEGFEGSGTEQDPLLIQTVEDLMNLSRPDVGRRGHYLRQTADIDCSTLSSWTEILFKGHYDGAGQTIKYKNSQNSQNALFSRIQAKSSIKNLKLNNLLLSNFVENSHITHCLSTGPLIKDNATRCFITACKSGGALIFGNAIDCTISTCKSDSFLINDTSINCTIMDCLAMIDYSWATKDNLPPFGGIAKNLMKGSLVERCFVGGNIKNTDCGEIYFSGIAADCSDSTIRQCAVGKFTLTGQNANWQRRITGPKTSNLSVFGGGATKHWLQNPMINTINTINTINKSTLENNASIKSNPGNDDINGNDGKTVSAAFFKQRYFERTLGWDFDTVWQWDDKEDRPALRWVGVASAAQAVNIMDLLTQKMRANIWL